MAGWLCDSTANAIRVVRAKAIDRNVSLRGSDVSFHTAISGGAMIRKVILLISMSIIASGCASQSFHETPYVTYSEGNSLSNTTVFSAVSRSPQAVAKITAIDGVSTTCWDLKVRDCPYWARLLPGDHTFRIDFVAVGGAALVMTNPRVDVQVKDMKARHVYTAHYVIIGNELRVDVEDLGENPDFGIILGRSRTHFPVKFD